MCLRYYLVVLFYVFTGCTCGFNIFGVPSSDPQQTQQFSENLNDLIKEGLSYANAYGNFASHLNQNSKPQNSIPFVPPIPFVDYVPNIPYVSNNPGFSEQNFIPTNQYTQGYGAGFTNNYNSHQGNQNNRPPPSYRPNGNGNYGPSGKPEGGYGNGAYPSQPGYNQGNRRPSNEANGYNRPTQPNRYNGNGNYGRPEPSGRPMSSYTGGVHVTQPGYGQGDKTSNYGNDNGQDNNQERPNNENVDACKINNKCGNNNIKPYKPKENELPQNNIDKDVNKDKDGENVAKTTESTSVINVEKTTKGKEETYDLDVRFNDQT